MPLTISERMPVQTTKKSRQFHLFEK